MKKRFGRRNTNKRLLDLHGLKDGRYGIIATMNMESDGHPVTAEAFLCRLRQLLADLENLSPINAPVTLIVDWPSSIRIRAVVLATHQGALLAETADEMSPAADKQTLEASALAEAEQISSTSAKTMQGGIDIGIKMAKEAERRTIPLNEANETMAASPDERISRNTYDRARGPEDHIQFSDSNRIIGGAKVIPATCRSTETFEITHCHLREIKPGKFRLESDSPNDDWWRLQAHTPGIDVVKGEPETPLVQSLLFTATAGIPVDMSVCVTEKIGTEERWVEPITLTNKCEVFRQGRDWLDNLEESLR